MHARTIGPDRRLLLALLAGGLVMPGTAWATRPGMHVHKVTGCGCCEAWAQLVRVAGYVVTVEEHGDLGPIRRQLGVPEALAGCHTAVLGTWLIEGHVPAAAIDRLLTERPQVRGLAVPGMPMGSPGMPSGTPATYEVIAFTAEGAAKVFMRFTGERAI